MKIIVLICILLSSISFAQGEAALPFLETPTNAEMFGMGYASVAHITDNPAALITNPSHLGMQSLNNSFFTLNENYSNWIPAFRAYNLDTWTRTIVANAGINLKYYPQLPPLSLGISYSNIHMQYGYYYSGGPDIVGNNEYTHDESNQVTLSIAADYFVRASIGITYKHVISDPDFWPTAGELKFSPASADLYDIGFLVDVPMVSLASKIISGPIKIYNNISPLFNFSLGISKNNLGQESVFYIDPSQADPLPRLARAGIGLNIGLQYNKDNISWIPFSFKWTVEANSLCIKTDTLGRSTYKPGLGDIDFFKEVILGKTNKETDKLKGWELNLFESFYLYGGSFREDPDRGNRNFLTNGYAVSLSGILKTFALINPGMFDNNIMKYFLNHIGVKYNQSIINTPESILNNTEYYSLNISFNNWL